MENGRCKCGSKFKEELTKAIADAKRAAQTISLSEPTVFNDDSKIKIACKKTWNSTRNFVRKGMEVQVRILKALKLQIESLKSSTEKGT